MSSHTPGPWFATARAVDNVGEDDYVLGWDVQGPPESERGQFARIADARLIAAAPELLAALESFMEKIDDSVDELTIEAFNAYGQCVEAIAKAEGREP